MNDRLNRIIEGWYIYENALFEICLTHTLRENNHIDCLMRCGQGVIEYNAAMLSPLDDDTLEELLMVQCIRLLLKHPYERQPDDCSPWARLTASDIVIGDNYDLKKTDLSHSKDFSFAAGKSFEWYAYHLQRGVNPQGPSSQQGEGEATQANSEYYADSTALWQEDTFKSALITQLVGKISRNPKNWGNLSNNLVEEIIANAKSKIDYRKVMAGFRSSILSSKRHLTRMRPNRRTGFDNMGSQRTLSTRLLVAVDVSGSISSESLCLFLSVVNKAFRYGIETLDVVTFDTMVHDIFTMRNAKLSIKITGRGGTNFQPVIDYAHEHKYDGVLIFTDGEAPTPQMPNHPRFKVAWIFESYDDYARNSSRLVHIGRCCPIEE